MCNNNLYVVYFTNINQTALYCCCHYKDFFSIPSKKARLDRFVYFRFGSNFSCFRDRQGALLNPPNEL